MKKKIRNILLLVVFACTWIVLFWITGDRTPWLVFTKPDPRNGISVSLGDVPAQNYDRMGFTSGLIRYIKKDQSWIVGTERGDIFHFSKDGRQLWKHSLGIGSISAFGISSDESVVYAGEKSPAGFLYAIQVSDGDVKWKYPASDLVGSDAGTQSYPSTAHICTDSRDRVFASFYRLSMDSRGSRVYAGRAVAFSSSGELLWKYPAEAPMDAWVNWCDVNDAAERFVLSTSNYEVTPERKYDKTLYLLDADTGRLISDTLVPPEAMFETTVFRGSPNYSADGKTMAGCASDGRAFLFDADGRILWMRNLSRPALAEGSWINASGRDGYIVPEGVVFATINTFNRENWQMPTPAVHPSSNGLFLFTLDGRYKFRYTARGEIEQLAFAPGIAAVAVGRNVRTHEYSAHGAAAVSLEDGRELSFFHTEGPLQGIAISADGKLIAGIEVPALTPEGKIIGAYRLHIWER